MNITVYGAGYVGLVTAAYFANQGHSTIVVDPNEEKISNLKKGIMPFFEYGLKDSVKMAVTSNTLSFDTNPVAGMALGHLHIIAVGTPMNDDGSCDISQVEMAATQIAHLADDNLIVVIRSTVPPGTAAHIRSVMVDEIKKAGLAIKVEVISNPEFLREGDAVHDMISPARIVIGSYSEYSPGTKLLSRAYNPHCKRVYMSNESAELTKYACNAMLATRISFMNEIATLADSVGADVDDIAKAMGMDSRIGSEYLQAGYGYGGSCLPKDVNALIHVANEADIEIPLIAGANETNALQAGRFIERILTRTDFKGKTVGIWGTAFKSGTNDGRGSLAPYVIKHLVNNGCTNFKIHDPMMTEDQVHSDTLSQFDQRMFTVVKSALLALTNIDFLIILMDDEQYQDIEPNEFVRYMTTPIIFDGRNIYDQYHFNGVPDVVEYYSIGRPTIGI